MPHTNTRTHTKNTHLHTHIYIYMYSCTYTHAPAHAHGHTGTHNTRDSNLAVAPSYLSWTTHMNCVCQRTQNRIIENSSSGRKHLDEPEGFWHSSNKTFQNKSKFSNRPAQPKNSRQPKHQRNTNKPRVTAFEGKHKKSDSQRKFFPAALAHANKTLPPLN